MLSKDKLERFMLTPWSFIALKLPVKLPLEGKAIDLSALPLVGYLEQVLYPMAGWAVWGEWVGRGLVKGMMRGGCVYSRGYEKEAAPWHLALAAPVPAYFPPLLMSSCHPLS